MNNTSAIIVAAGRGTRMGPQVDKIFLELAGAPVVAHTWLAWDRSGAVDEIILVVRDGMQPEFDRLAADIGVRVPWHCVAGGRERQDSVQAGLHSVSTKTAWVAIHDGARPCISQKTITACLDAARRTGAAVAAQRAVDTIKESDGGHRIARHLDRARLWTVQTPQCFRLEVIRKAIATAASQGLSLSDDTAACELIGQPVELVDCAEPNPKVTSPGDLPWIESILRTLNRG